MQEQFSYGYDAAWNLNKRTNNALVQAFNVNNLNALTTATNSGTLTVAGNTTATATSVTVNSQAATLYGDNTFAKAGFTLTNGNNAYTAIAQDSLGRKDTNSITFSLSTSNNFTYDANGNLVYDGNRAFDYDDENQLTRVTVTNEWKSEFAYDGKMRRRIRNEYTWSGSWVQTNEVRYLYDGRLVIQERDVNNLATVSYTRGHDLSGARQEAGGIGGFLARSDHSTLSPQHTYYHADGNGNVTLLLSSNQTVAARYAYDPYGNMLAMSGPLAGANLYRFSSKESHPNSGLVHYLYRYYEPNLQRWLNRDPLDELGGWNLFEFVLNRPVNFFDPYGLECGGNGELPWAEEAKLTLKPRPKKESENPLGDFGKALAKGLWELARDEHGDTFNEWGENLKERLGLDSSNMSLGSGDGSNKDKFGLKPKGLGLEATMGRFTLSVSLERDSKKNKETKKKKEGVNCEVSLSIKLP